ncbi:hypothetical protein DRN85_07565 [Methanosarcinales archaeon]|nr:MAG: hypothetical protein DRN85_07565 [Methanosarcinales archaeon]
MIKIVDVGREGTAVVFEVEFDFRGEIHRLTIKKTVDELLAFENKEAFLDYVKKVVNDKRTELFADLADKFVPLNEDIEAEEVSE